MVIPSDHTQIRSITQCVTHSCRPNNTGCTKTSDRSHFHNVSEAQRDFNSTLWGSPSSSIYHIGTHLILSHSLSLSLSIVLAVIYPRARRALIIVLTVRNAGWHYERSTVPRGTVTFKLTGSTPARILTKWCKQVVRPCRSLEL